MIANANTAAPINPAPYINDEITLITGWYVHFTSKINHDPTSDGTNINAIISAIPKPFGIIDFYIGEPFDVDGLEVEVAKKLIFDKLMENQLEK